MTETVTVKREPVSSRLHRRYREPHRCGRTGCTEIHEGYFECLAKWGEHVACPGFQRIPIGTRGEDDVEPGTCQHRCSSKENAWGVTDKCWWDKR